MVLKTTCGNIHIKLLRTILSGKAGMIMNTSTAYYSGAESISNKKFANNQARRHTLYIKDPASAITHFIGAIFSLGASSPLLIKAAQTHQPVNIIAMIIYSISLVALYSASTAYHTIPAGHPYEETLKKLDHMMIFVLIAGSYTPVCLLAIPGMTGYILLAVVDLFCFVYCTWLGMCICISSASKHTEHRMLLMASCRRSYLHCRRCHLCTEIVCF